MSAPLRLVESAAGAASATSSRSPLFALVALEPVHVSEENVDLVALANAGEQVLDLDADISRATAAQLALDWFIEYEGLHARTDGERAESLISYTRRYVLPHLIETALAAPADRRTVEDLTFAQAQALALTLAGKRELPAATVAGDMLNRAAVTCVWLTMQEAGEVSHGGLKAVSDACAEGRVVARRNGRGPILVQAAELRAAGLLVEPERPHGMQRESAKNVLFVLKQAMLRARDHGAALRGDYTRLVAIAPAGKDLARQPRTDPGYLPVDAARQVAGHLSVVHQLTLWLLRLTGMRIGEAFGLLVKDFFQVSDGSWALRIEKQGGEWKLVRDGDTGRFVYQPYKEGTKTEQSMRTVRVPELLASLLHEVIEVFHTRDGVVLAENRLIPGLGKDQASGMSSFRSALDGAQAAAGLVKSVPHDMRGFVITDHRNAGVDDRLGEYYVGHGEQKRTVHAGYDDGVPVELQTPATDAMADLLAAAGMSALIVPTDKREGWGRDTVLGRQREALLARMAARGWFAAPEGVEADAVLLSTRQVAEAVGKHEAEVRRMLQSGAIRGAKVLVSGALTWRVDERDLRVFLEARSGSSLHDVAARIGLSYHQARDLCLRLGVLSTSREKGTAIRLGPEDVARVEAEMKRVRAASQEVLDLQAAADRLGLPVGQVEKLVRSGDLVRVDDPRGTRRRHVSAASVKEYSQRMNRMRSGGEELFVPFQDARRALGLTRNRVSELIGLGWLTAATINRRQHVGMTSLLEYAGSRGLSEAVVRELGRAAVAA